MSLKKDKSGKCEKNAKRENGEDGFGNKSVQESAVSMRVKNDDGFLSPYSNIGEEIISADVAEFLDNAVKSRRVKNLSIFIESDEIDEQESVVYEQGIRNYYANRIADIDRRLTVNAVSAAVMTLIAVVVFALYIALEVLKTGYIVLAITDIAAWVFMWEAIDLFFIQRKILKFEKMRDNALMTARIVFTRPQPAAE